jgi:hypothetical protein
VLPKDYSVEDTALFFARAALANYDTQLTGWRVKYNTAHWRPLTAFRTGFPGFKARPDWEALIPVGQPSEVLRRGLIDCSGCAWLHPEYIMMCWHGCITDFAHVTCQGSK